MALLLCASMLAAFPLALAFAAAAVGDAATLWFVTSDDGNDLLTLCAAPRAPAPSLSQPRPAGPEQPLSTRTQGN